MKVGVVSELEVLWGVRKGKGEKVRERGGNVVDLGNRG